MPTELNLLKAEALDPIMEAISQDAQTASDAADAVAGIATGLNDRLTIVEGDIVSIEGVLISGVKRKVAVDFATTANITLSGEQTVDGTLRVAGKTGLVKDHTNPALNGLYTVVSGGAWTRRADMDAAGEVQGALVEVQSGTANGGNRYFTGSAVTTLGTDAIVWQFDGNQSALQTQIDAVSDNIAERNGRDISPMQLTRGFVQDAAGALVSAADYEVTDFIPVEAGDVISYTGVAAVNAGVHGYGIDQAWVGNLNPFTGTRVLYTNTEITIPSGVFFINAASAFDNTSSPSFPKRRLKLLKNGFELRATYDDLPDFENELVTMTPRLIHGETMLTGTGINLLEAVTYHRTEYLPVLPGEVIFYTGVASDGNGRVKGFDADFAWVSDLLVTSTGARTLASDAQVVIPDGVAYIAACSSYLPGGGYAGAPLVLKRYLDVALKFLTAPEVPLSTSTTKIFRSMCYNIWEGGRTADGRTAVMRHISRANPDFISMQEAGDVAGVLIPLLEAEGFTSFYGPGGTFGLLFASKLPVTFSATMTNVNWSRNPLYNEVTVGDDTVGVVSVHLDSSGTGFIHDEDYKNVAPQEPAGQRRAIQMYQIMDYLNARKIANPSVAGFIIQGDYNAPHDEFNVETYAASIGETSLPTGLSYPLPNRQFPYQQFEYCTDKILLDTSPAVNGDGNTWWNETLNGNAAATFPIRLDYIAHSEQLVKLGAEILNSVADHGLPDRGIRKFGGPLGPREGFTASDHIGVVADFIIP